MSKFVGYLRKHIYRQKSRNIRRLNLPFHHPTSQNKAEFWLGIVLPDIAHNLPLAQIHLIPMEKVDSRFLYIPIFEPYYRPQLLSQLLLHAPTQFQLFHTSDGCARERSWPLNVLIVRIFPLNYWLT